MYITTLLTLLIAPLAFASPLAKRDVLTGEHQQQILSMHNTLRARYDAQPLRWDPNLAESSLQWSSLCRIGAHSQIPNGNDYGENIAATSDRNNGMKPLVEFWMSEESNYNFTTPGAQWSAGHFTAMIWRETTTVGCGLASCPQAWTTYWQLVCRYGPKAGNWGWPADYARNLVKPGGVQPEQRQQPVTQQVQQQTQNNPNGQQTQNNNQQNQDQLQPNNGNSNQQTSSSSSSWSSWSSRR